MCIAAEGERRQMDMQIVATHACWILNRLRFSRTAPVVTPGRLLGTSHDIRKVGVETADRIASEHNKKIGALHG